MEDLELGRVESVTEQPGGQSSNPGVVAQDRARQAKSYFQAELGRHKDVFGRRPDGRIL